MNRSLFTPLLQEVKKLGGNRNTIQNAFKKGSKSLPEIARLIVGTKKLTLKYLALVQENIQIAGEAFSKPSFFLNGPKLYLWDNFKNRVLSEIPDLIPAFTGSVIKTQLTKNMTDAEIQAELGNPTPFTVPEFAAIISNLIGKQPKGENGILLNNGYANIFYVKLANGSVVAVFVGWFGGDRGWYFTAVSLDSGLWFGGRCVFSRS